MTTNERVFSWFEAGNIESAIDGEGEYFIPDVTFKDRHDLVLIISQLILWAFARNLQKAVDGFMRSLDGYLKQSDLFKALDLYFAYRIVVESEGESLPLDEDALRVRIADLIREKARELTCDENLRSMSLRFLNKYPDLKGRVGIENMV